MSADTPTFDLQSHSTHSDGALPPSEVVARAAAAGVELLALSDHDTVAGVPEALAAAREHGIRLSPAAELSSVHGEHEDLHILGYEIDPADPVLLAALEDFRADRGRLGDPGDGVVIGEREQLDARGGRARHHLCGRQRSVGVDRVGLQIERRGVRWH